MDQVQNRPLRCDDRTSWRCRWLFSILMFSVGLLVFGFNYRSLKKLGDSDQHVGVSNYSGMVSNKQRYFGGRPCPTIDPTKRQILLLNVGSVRSFMYPTAQRFYYSNQFETIQNNSNAQVHQIWYFSLHDAMKEQEDTRKGPAHRKKQFPVTNLTHLQYLQNLYNVPVLELYNSSATYQAISNYSLNRKCSETHGSGLHFFKRSPHIYAQARAIQSAFDVALKYATACKVEWSYLIRTRPDYICTSPLGLNLSQYLSQEKFFIQDEGWVFKVADFFYALDRAAAESLLTNFTENYHLPCDFTPPGGAEPFLKAILNYQQINLLSSPLLNMCALGRTDFIQCDFGRAKGTPKLCRNVAEYVADARKIRASQ
mmetsp:Transcript_36925/g.66416  ORF Transcript_36925/g.66416 Transcript_36925/m.66416 type:complete len:370 (+) Transcript_36925:227-1336(+)